MAATAAFIVIEVTTGTTQNIGIAFSALIPVFLLAEGINENWKNVPTAVHQIIITLSLISLFGFVLVRLIFSQNQNAKI